MNPRIKTMSRSQHFFDSAAAGARELSFWATPEVSTRVHGDMALPLNDLVSAAAEKKWDVVEAQAESIMKMARLKQLEAAAAETGVVPKL